MVACLTHGFVMVMVSTNQSLDIYTMAIFCYEYKLKISASNLYCNNMSMEEVVVVVVILHDLSWLMVTRHNYYSLTQLVVRLRPLRTISF